MFLDIKVSPESVIYPGQDETSIRKFREGDILNKLPIALFATLPESQWITLVGKYSNKELTEKALKRTIELTGDKIHFLKSYDEKKQYEILRNLSRGNWELAEAVGKYIVSEATIKLDEQGGNKLARNLFQSVATSLTQNYQTGKANAIDWDAHWAAAQNFERDFIWCSGPGLIADPYCQSLVYGTASQTLEGFADGRNADSLWGLANGVASVFVYGYNTFSPAAQMGLSIPYDPLPDPTWFGNKSEYEIGRITGVVAGNVEMMIGLAAIQAGPKAALVVVKGAVPGEWWHLGVDAVANESGLIWKAGESVNVFHLGWGGFGPHAGVYGAGLPPEIAAKIYAAKGVNAVGTWAHFYPSKMYVAGIGDVAYSAMQPYFAISVAAGASLLGGRQPNYNQFYIPWLRISMDPNQITSTPGAGFIKINQTLNLRIDFENLKDASANATNIRVEIPIDIGLDMDSYKYNYSSHQDIIKEEINKDNRTIT